MRAQEKRRFAERWPDRVYRHLPETTQVVCEADGARCTVRASFDFLATNPHEGRGPSLARLISSTAQALHALLPHPPERSDQAKVARELIAA
jgi:hypothetical protein